METKTKGRRLARCSKCALVRDVTGAQQALAGKEGWRIRGGTDRAPRWLCPSCFKPGRGQATAQADGSTWKVDAERLVSDDRLQEALEAKVSQITARNGLEADVTKALRLVMGMCSSSTCHAPLAVKAAGLLIKMHKLGE